MKKIIQHSVLVASLIGGSQAIASEGLGLGVNYGAFSGPSLELTYPVSDTLQVRGALSNGMGVSETSSDTDINYQVKADGGIHRLALDYHPFSNGFFLSAGYAVNNFELSAAGSGTNVTVGNTAVTGNVSINGTFSWSNAPTLSLGWGHSPQEGLGFMLEAGAFMTGKPDVNLIGSCSGGPCTGFDAALVDEEAKLKKDVADFDFLPMLQAGLTYRF